jgi:hypothetical protein
MKMGHAGWSRRDALLTLAGGITASAVQGISQSRANDKMTKQQAKYQDTPNSIYSCGNCSLFERPKSCKVVEGEVSEDGWCKAFAFVD